MELNKPYLRVKIRVNTDSPLQPGFYIPRGGQEPIWLTFKYERLSSVCLHCGRIDHSIGQCMEEDQHPYHYHLGAAMRGDPPVPIVVLEKPQEGTTGGKEVSKSGLVGENSWSSERTHLKSAVQLEGLLRHKPPDRAAEPDTFIAGGAVQRLQPSCKSCRAAAYHAWGKTALWQQTLAQTT